jgi:hypothetical protein
MKAKIFLLTLIFTAIYITSEAQCKVNQPDEISGFWIAREGISAINDTLKIDPIYKYVSLSNPSKETIPYYNIIAWQIRSVQDFNYVSIKQPPAGKYFVTIITVDEKGTSYQFLSYHDSTSSQISEGANFRNQQVLFDGAFSDSDLITVEFTPAGNFVVTIFPNKYNGRIFSIL